MSGPDPYEELARLAEAALRRAEAGELAALEETLGRCAAIRATLPPRPPAPARPALERAAAAQERLQAHLATALAATRAEIDRTERGQRAARSYGTAPPALLDRSA